jgi:hypothetical protein
MMILSLVNLTVEVRITNLSLKGEKTVTVNHGEKKKKK